MFEREGGGGEDQGRNKLSLAFRTSVTGKRNGIILNQVNQDLS